MGFEVSEQTSHIAFVIAVILFLLDVLFFYPPTSGTLAMSQILLFFALVAFALGAGILGVTEGTERDFRDALMAGFVAQFLILVLHWVLGSVPNPASSNVIFYQAMKFVLLSSIFLVAIVMADGKEMEALISSSFLGALLITLYASLFTAIMVPSALDAYSGMIGFLVNFGAIAVSYYAVRHKEF